MTDSEALWYCQEGDADPTGPGRTDELVNAIRAGGITRTARVSRASDARWTPIVEVPAFAIAFRDAPAAQAAVAHSAPLSESLPEEDEIDHDLREPPSPKLMLWGAGSIATLTLLWEAFAWVGTEHIRAHEVSATVEGRLMLALVIFPGVALVFAIGLGIVGLSRHTRRKDWLLQREAPAPTGR